MSLYGLARSGATVLSPEQAKPDCRHGVCSSLCDRCWGSVQPRRGWASEIRATQNRSLVAKLHRLDEVSVEAGLLGKVPVFFLTKSRPRHEQRVVETEILAKVAGYLQTAHVRHGYVAYHHFRRLHPGQGQPRLAIVGGSYLVPVESEQHRHAVGQVHVVINEQDASSGCINHSPAPFRRGQSGCG